MLLQENKNLEMSNKYDIGDQVEYTFLPGHPNIVGVIDYIKFDKEKRKYKYSIKDTIFWIYESAIIRVISRNLSNKQRFNELL